jgi:hypothetical protein
MLHRTITGASFPGETRPFVAHSSPVGMRNLRDRERCQWGKVRLAKT